MAELPLRSADPGALDGTFEDKALDEPTETPYSASTATASLLDPRACRRRETTPDRASGYVEVHKNKAGPGRRRPSLGPRDSNRTDSQRGIVEVEGGADRRARCRMAMSTCARRRARMLPPATEGARTWPIWWQPSGSSTCQDRRDTIHGRVRVTARYPSPRTESASRPWTISRRPTCGDRPKDAG